jgi:hypothetical protein
MLYKQLFSVMSQQDAARMAFAPSRLLAIITGYSQWEHVRERAGEGAGCAASLMHTSFTIDACVVRRSSTIMPSARSGLARAPRVNRAIPAPPPWRLLTARGITDLVRRIPNRTAMHTTEESPMSIQQTKPMARRFVEETGAKNMTLMRYTMRQALGALLGGLILLSLSVPHPVQAQETFTTASLQGTYTYVNNTANVGSLGLITFDGAGELTAEIKVNLPDETGAGRSSPRAGQAPTPWKRRGLGWRRSSSRRERRRMTL